MTGVRKRITITAVAAGAAAVLLAAGYVSGVGPLGRSADVEAADVCATLGDRERAVEALRTALPDAAEYGFDADDPRRAGSDDHFLSSCFVQGGEESLLDVVTELARTAPPRQWLDGQVRGDYTHDGERDAETSFEAGAKAVVTSHTAAVYVPCVPEGVFPGGSQSLSVVVHADRDSGAEAAATRQALADLAVGAARHAHERAGCELPSRLPRSAPEVTP